MIVVISYVVNEFTCGYQQKGVVNKISFNNGLPMNIV